MIFDYDEWHRYKNYMTIVQPEENKNLQGDEGMFCMQKTFKLAILAAYVDDEQMERVIDSIPKIENFRICVIGVPDKEDFSMQSRGAMREMEAKDQGAGGFVKRKFFSYDQDDENRIDYYDTWLTPSFRKKP